MFFEAFKQFTDKDVFVNWQKNFNFINFDNSSIIELAQKNVDALMKAGQASAENAQAIMRRIGEVVQNQVGEAVEASRDFMPSSNPEQAMHKQQQYLKAFISNTINYSKEMIEMGAKSMMEVYDIFNKRINENIDSSFHSKKSK